MSLFDPHNSNVQEKFTQLQEQYNVSAEDIRPMSYNQQAMWFLQKLDPTTTIYNVGFAVHIEAVLEATHMQQALQLIVNRHEVLRTIYPEINGRPVQVVLPQRKVSFEVVDTTSWSKVDVEQAVDNHYHKTFDLICDHVLQTRLYMLNKTHFILQVVAHHVAVDAWSIWLIVDELRKNLAILQAGNTPIPKPLRSRYSDFVLWQRDLLAGESGQAMADFWREELVGDLPTLDLSGKRTRSTDEQISYAQMKFTIESDLVQKVRDLAFSEGTSTYSFLLAVFQILLSKYSGQQEILVGTPVHGRGTARFAKLIGYFVNLALMRGNIDHDDSFRTFLRKSGKKVQAALLNQHYPFAMVADQNRPVSRETAQELIQVVFNLIKPPKKLKDLATVWLDDTGSAQIDIDNFVINHLDMEYGYGINSIDLYLEIIDFKEQLIAKLGYNEALFEPETISRMVEHFYQLLQNIVENPDQPIGNLSVLSMAEQEKLIYTWNDTAVPLPHNQFIHTLFEEQAQRTPEKTAVSFKDQSLTYQELDEQSNQLARYLQSLGVGPETVVGVFVERSLDMVVGLFGILKASGAYLPLDPSFPADRLAFMVEDAAVEVILTQTDLLNAPLAANAAHPVCLDTDWSQIAQVSAKALPHTSVSTNCAYIIYTSGSTGKPKGVQIEHRNVVNFMTAMQQQLGISSVDILLSVTTLSFDISILELFLPLLNGAQVVIADRLTAVDGRELSKAINQVQATILQATPTTWSMLVDAGWQNTPTLRKALCGGEALTRELAQSILTRDVDLWNMYGPTETTIWSSVKQITADQPQITIGRPIGNNTFYVLDATGQPVPIGVAGELYIGGEGVARGYLNHPQLTGERFPPDPYTDWSSTGRMYRTGDLVRYLVDGDVEYLDRIDFQVKMHGHRIELGEIEAVLSAHPHVREVVVTVYTNHNAPILAAYIVPPDEEELPTVTALCEYLRTRLPDYMIPSAFVYLAEFPLTPNRKINRKALPAPDSVRPDLAQAYVKPRTPQEKMLADVWASVLQVDQVGIHDNFFTLGGHSLLATQVVSRMEKATGISVSLRTLFDTPTIAGVSMVLNQDRRGATLPPLPPMVPVSRNSYIPLSFAQERMWFLHQLDPNDHAYNVPVTFAYQQAIDRDAMQKAFDALVVRHESLRTIFPITDGVPHQEILPPFSVNINEIDLSTIPAEEQETAVIHLLQADTKLPYNFTTDPPWRFFLICLNDEAYVFYLSIHHILIDQWSTFVLIQDLLALYNACLKGETPTLPALNIQYADFSVWQRNWLQGSVLADMLDYWRRQLVDLPVLDMPTDHPRPPVQTFIGATEFLYLSPSLTESLRIVSRQAQVSPFMLMLAAFNMLLARYTGQNDIAVGVPVANRHYLAVEPIIGVFVNTLVVRTDLSGDPSFAQLLERVRDVLLDAYAYQELPFEKLVSEIVETRDLSHTPLVQVLFNMTNAPFDYEQATESPISSMTFDRGAAQFDLLVNVVMEEHLPIEPQILLEYNTALFEQDTIQRFLAHYEAVLVAIVANIEQPISNYDILSMAERERLITEWNQTQMPSSYPLGCLHELFVEQARNTPQKTAVSFKDQSFTYQELDERSNQLAHYLQSLGVGPEIVVGVFVERSLEMVVGLLGILKAGGAFLPLDPTFPADRLAFMVEDTQIEVILTQADLLNVPPASNAAHSVCLDTDWPQIESFSVASLLQTYDPQNLAYIIYTSGSTGKPKGVQIEHCNIVNNLTAMQQQICISPDDILLSVTTLSFDPSILDIFLPLLNGAQIVIVDWLMSTDGRELSKTISQVQATILQATPTTWTMLLDAGWQNTPTLRQALCGGEVLTRELAQSILARNVKLWNIYGPTETTIWSSVQQITPDQKQITIGKPIGNNTFYVLDAVGQPVPIGVVGELLIGGDDVARGYLNRPKLNEERFLPDPYTSWSRTGRMYRTGDLVRYLADGTVEYVGRIDFQVKIHGHRIELGEIETALSSHSHVREIVVTVHSSQNNQILVAYIIPHNEEEHPTTTSLREYLRTLLPDYMIPSAFIYLSEFPLTPNRKINRKALPAPSSFRPDLETTYIAPRTDLETVLTDVLVDLLGLEKAGIQDNFFELGGHSLQATRYVARVSQALRMDLSLWSFLRSPDVANLAAYLTDLPEGSRINRIAQLRVKMATMSPDEVQQLLEKKSHLGENEG